VLTYQLILFALIFAMLVCMIGIISRFEVSEFTIPYCCCFCVEVTLNRFVALESGTKNIGSYKLKFNHTQIKPTHSSSHLSRGTRNLNSKLKYKLIKDQLVF